MYNDGSTVTNRAEFLSWHQMDYAVIFSNEGLNQYGVALQNATHTSLMRYTTAAVIVVAHHLQMSF